jgi:hypothetical protein
MAVVDRVIDLLVEHGDSKTVPPTKFFDSIVDVLGTKYPAVFGADPTTIVDGKKVRMFSTRGTGGVNGIKGLARVMSQKYRRIIDKRNGKDLKRKEIPDVPEVVPGEQKRKKKKVVGVIRHRFFPDKNSKDDVALLDALRHLESSDPCDRERVYEKNRVGVQLLFIKSLDILSCVPRFFESPVHCQKHFEYLGGTNVLENIQSDMSEQFEVVKSVVEVWCTSEASKLRMEAAELRSKEIQGSQVPVYVGLLRELSYFWHQDLGGFIRFPEEAEPNCPHLLCRELRGTTEFDFHLEQKKVLRGMTFPVALASFFHIVFIGQLKYPPKGESVAILLQRRLAKVDEEGT